MKHGTGINLLLILLSKGGGGGGGGPLQNKKSYYHSVHFLLQVLKESNIHLLQVLFQILPIHVNNVQYQVGEF